MSMLSYILKKNLKSQIAEPYHLFVSAFWAIVDLVVWELGMRRLPLPLLLPLSRVCFPLFSAKMYLLVAIEQFRNSDLKCAIFQCLVLGVWWPSMSLYKILAFGFWCVWGLTAYKDPQGPNWRNPCKLPNFVLVLSCMFFSFDLWQQQTLWEYFKSAFCPDPIPLAQNWIEQVLWSSTSGFSIWTQGCSLWTRYVTNSWEEKKRWNEQVCGALSAFQHESEIVPCEVGESWIRERKKRKWNDQVSEAPLSDVRSCRTQNRPLRTTRITNSWDGKGTRCSGRCTW